MNEKEQKLITIAESEGIVVQLRENPKPEGADIICWKMLDRPKANWDKNGHLKYVIRPRDNRKNLKIIFENDPKYSGLIQYHDHATSLLLNGEIIEKADWEDIGIDLCTRYRLESKDSSIQSAMYRVGFRNQIHPIKDFLNTLVWDGIPRIETFAEDILKAEYTDQTIDLIRSKSKKMFIACVARILNPGCEMHTMPIFIGDKGWGKSMVIKFLTPDYDWFGRTKMKIGDKSALELIHQTGVWIQEIAELADFQGRHASDTKAFITCEIDRYRIVYDKDIVKKKRRICFFGTSNDKQILDDGWERRFWVFQLTGKVNLQYLLDDNGYNRDQIWAEAVKCYEEGEQWHLTDLEEEALKHYQETFLVDDPWAWGVSKAIDHWKDRNGLGATTEAIMVYIELPVSQRHTGNSRRVAQICRDNGWTMKRTSQGRFWTKP